MKTEVLFNHNISIVNMVPNMPVPMVKKLSHFSMVIIPMVVISMSSMVKKENQILVT